MTKREWKRVVEERRDLAAIQRGLAQAARLELTKHYDIATCVLGHLRDKQALDRAVKRFERHRKADPHCTCNDCLSFAEGNHPSQHLEY